MKKEKAVSINISVAEKYRDLLREMAAEENLNNTKDWVSVSSIGRIILTEYLDQYLNNEEETPNRKEGDK